MTSTLLPQEAQEKLEDFQGICLDKFEPGTEIEVRTRNSMYRFKVVDRDRVTVQGGSLCNGNVRYPEPVPAQLQGACWGGYGVLKVHWIGYEMNLSFLVDGKVVPTITSHVLGATVTGPDGAWSYDLAWGGGKSTTD